MNSFRYYITQAFKGFFRNGLTSMTSVFIIMCCLLIFGLFSALTLNINHITSQIEQRCEIQVFMDKSTTPEQLADAQKQILQLSNIRSATIFSKEDTLNYMREIFADNAAALDGYEGENNPYRDSFKITLKDLSMSEETIKQLGEIDNVAEVSNNREVLTTILNTSNTLKNASLAVMLLLCFISIFIIANTIKIAVFSRRKEIAVMKFVGATNWFIRWPFIFEGIITGIIGALLSFALISWGYIVLYSKASTVSLDVFSLLPYSAIWFVLLICFISIGTLIGAVGSGFSIRKHLKV